MEPAHGHVPRPPLRAARELNARVLVRRRCDALLRDDSDAHDVGRREVVNVERVGRVVEDVEHP